MKSIKTGDRVRIKSEAALRSVYNRPLSVKTGVTDYADQDGNVLTEGMISRCSTDDRVKQVIGKNHVILEQSPGYIWNTKDMDEINRLKYLKLKKLFEMDAVNRELQVRTSGELPVP